MNKFIKKLKKGDNVKITIYDGPSGSAKILSIDTKSIIVDFDLEKIAHSGQCFRVREFEDGTFREYVEDIHHS